ncbi:MAG: hybrid sensor histidine kinase/response regulator [Chloroflexota bacterium]
MKSELNIDPIGIGDILVVDDTPLKLRLLSNLLTKQGYRVTVMQDGASALEAIKTYTPDLILLDINMPGLDGYEVCRRLKAQEATKEIPVIFISSFDEVWDKVQAFQVGGVDYITKPFQVEEVLARVKVHISLRQLQQQLQHTNDNLLESNTALAVSNKELNAFAHTVAHDLKNPLTTIVSYSSYLSDSIQEIDVDRLKHDLNIIGQAGGKMTSIIDELLLLASIRKTDVEVRQLDMTAIIEQVCQRMAFMIESYQGKIQFPTYWPKSVGYAPWVEEIWANYISNGLKYGGHPPTLELGATEQTDGFVRYWLRDNGPGIPFKKQQYLFQEFSRIDQDNREGHGLGLSIVKRIVDKLAGDVGVTSIEGEGSTFYFTLPHK